MAFFMIVARNGQIHSLSGHDHGPGLISASLRTSLFVTCHRIGARFLVTIIARLYLRT